MFEYASARSWGQLSHRTKGEPVWQSHNLHPELEPAPCSPGWHSRPHLRTHETRRLKGEPRSGLLSLQLPRSRTEHPSSTWSFHTYPCLLPPRVRRPLRRSLVTETTVLIPVSTVSKRRCREVLCVPTRLVPHSDSSSDKDGSRFGKSWLRGRDDLQSTIQGSSSFYCTVTRLKVLKSKKFLKISTIRLRVLTYLVSREFWDQTS